MRVRLTEHENIINTPAPGVRAGRILSYMILLDALFFPYIRPLRCSMSMILLTVWYFFHLKTILHMKYFQIVMLSGAVVFLSTLRGIMLYPQNLPDNMVQMITIVYCMMYNAFFLYAAEKYEIAFERIFYIQIIFSAVMACIYIARPQMYFDLRSLWTMSGTKIRYYGALYNRYTFLQSDPNSNGCILCAMMLYLFLNEKNSQSAKKLVTAFLTGISVAVSLSTTGVIVYILSLLLFFVTKKWYHIRTKIKRVNFLTLCFLAAASLTGIVIFAGHVSATVQLKEVLWERISITTGDGTMSGRTVIWKQILSSYNWLEYLILGKGSTLTDRYGIMRMAHNGHFHMILAYGLAGYLIFLYVYFRKSEKRPWKEYISMIPLFLLFSVNTLVIDYRASIALAVISAAYHSAGRKWGTPRAFTEKTSVSGSLYYERD